MAQNLSATVQNKVDLAAKTMGGEVLYASDDFFAAKENLIKEGRGKWDPELFSDKGKVYDGWESRRNRTDDNDWVIIKLASTGSISLIDIDTNHFLGNAPQFASVEVIDTRELSYDDIENVTWEPILSVSAIKPGVQNLFVAEVERSATYARLQIYPDGGVARLRLYGIPEYNPRDDEVRDYACSINGGRAVVASDMFFGEIANLIKPSVPANMGDGWETKRRRGKGHDWVIIQLGAVVVPEEFIVDTKHFKGNYPDTCSIEVIDGSSLSANQLVDSEKWTEVISDYKLRPDKRHRITEFSLNQPITHVRLRIFPDGGVARFKVVA